MKMYSLNSIYNTKNALLTICTLANIKYVIYKFKLQRFSEILSVAKTQNYIKHARQIPGRCPRAESRSVAAFHA